ncbi:MAG: AbrB/MazE/SpoVT family DNA-binding domain-containing protein [Candidatus Thorarchaeota archaeon]
MEKPLSVVKITRNHQVSIPKEARKFLDLQIGDFIAFMEKIEDGVRKLEIKKVQL